MKALFELFRRFDARRIFGFIRRLGGMSRPKVECYDLRSTHALRVEGNGSRFYRPAPYRNFYPRPPGGGRHLLALPLPSTSEFLSTPSGWRATALFEQRKVLVLGISIHALRVEGDQLSRDCYHCALAFLSTPSGWRATTEGQIDSLSLTISIHALRVEGDSASSAPIAMPAAFLSTPSGWRATAFGCGSGAENAISIHALRVEGDHPDFQRVSEDPDFYPRPPGGGRQIVLDFFSGSFVFLSTPSGWRATAGAGGHHHERNAISIHALRVEGDLYFFQFLNNPVISIHALRVEGDGAVFILYPGGFYISIHALRVEGDMRCTWLRSLAVRFLSTPSGWRATM